MSNVPGSIPYLQKLAKQQLIDDLVLGVDASHMELNDTNWATLSAAEKDAAARLAQQALARLIRSHDRLVRYCLDDLSEVT